MYIPVGAGGKGGGERGCGGLLSATYNDIYTSVANLHVDLHVRSSPSVVVINS